MKLDDITVFISYSRTDFDQISPLYNQLCEKTGLKVILDIHDNVGAEEWRSQLEDQISQCDCLVFLITDNSVSSDTCGWEIQQARRLGKRIAPVLMEDVNTSKLPAEIEKIHYISHFPELKPAKTTEALFLAVSTDRSWVREHTRLGEMSLRWDQSGRPSSQLLRGKDLERAEEWSASQPQLAPSLSNYHREYILGSRRYSNSQGRARFTIASAVLIVLGAAAIIAWMQRNTAIEQRTEAERAQAKAIESAEISNGLVVLLFRYLKDVGEADEEKVFVPFLAWLEDHQTKEVYSTQRKNLENFIFGSLLERANPYDPEGVALGKLVARNDLVSYQTKSMILSGAILELVEQDESRGMLLLEENFRTLLRAGKCEAASHMIQTNGCFEQADFLRSRYLTTYRDEYFTYCEKDLVLEC